MVANNMLLAVHCKKTDQVDLKGPICKYITATYGDHQAKDAGDDLAAVQQLRNDVAGLTGALPALRDTLAKCVFSTARLTCSCACFNKSHCLSLSVHHWQFTRTRHSCHKHSALFLLWQYCTFFVGTCGATQQCSMPSAFYCLLTRTTPAYVGTTGR